MHFTDDAQQEKPGLMPLFACVLWIAAALFAFHWALPGENNTDEILALAAGNQDTLRSAAPMKEQSTPARNPMRAAALDAWHLKTAPLRLDSGHDSVLLPASSAFDTSIVGSATFGQIALRPAGISGRTLSARAPPVIA
ncbi:hypothetical protein [Phyllobacterium salinisoli]|nr:hypothetical protein [Phyllobacterium salinisoli]